MIDLGKANPASEHPNAVHRMMDEVWYRKRDKATVAARASRN
jgi:hypothetical protein